MAIGAVLPWQAGLVLSVVAYLGFHYIASLPMSPLAATDLKQFGQAIGGSVVRQFAITFSTFLQYIVPIALLIGAAMSFVRRRRRSELHQSVAGDPSRDALERMSWREFEGLTAEVFRRKGFRVVERGGGGADGGVDIELHAGKDKYLVQCKQWKVAKVGVATVRELYGVMAAEAAVGGFVVTSGEFTAEAKKFAEGRAIELVSTETVLRMVEETAGNRSSVVGSAAAEPRCPRCGGAMVERVNNAGSPFWGCSRYPSCRGTRSALREAT